MSDNRKKIKSNLQHSSTTKNLVVSVEQLLNDCKKFGTIPFSTMARIAFIGSVMLKSLQKQGYLDSSFVENFMNSISSPLSEIQDDMNAVINNKLSKKQFLKKYGHLRPGTYDITARRYDIQKKFFDNKLRVQFSADGIVQKFFEGRVDYANLNYDLVSSWEAPTFQTRITWNFGNQNLKSRESRRSSSASERNRVNGN